MKNEISNRKWFLESFDTVRDAIDLPPDEVAFNRCQAGCELVLALLFGCRVAVPRPLVTDSRLFAWTAREALKARPNLRDDNERRKGCPVWHPFVFGRQNGIAGVASAMKTDLMNEDFLFSSIPGLNRPTGSREKVPPEILEIRRMMADDIMANEWERAAGHVGDAAAHLGEALPALDAEFKNPGAWEQTVAAEPLPNYLNSFKDPYNSVSAFLDSLNDLGVDAADKRRNSRSYVRSSRDLLLETGKMNRIQYLTIVELLDNAYNHVVALSNQVVGRFDSASTDLNTDISRSVENHHALALSSTGLTTSPMIFQVTGPFRDAVGKTCSTSWDEVWSWLWNELFLNPKWQDSVSNLHASGQHSSWTQGWEKECADYRQRVLEDHSELLARLLTNSPFTLEAQGSSGLIFRARNAIGGTFSTFVKNGAEVILPLAVAAWVEGTLVSELLAGGAAYTVASGVRQGIDHYQARCRFGVASRMLQGIALSPAGDGSNVLRT